MPHNPSFSVGVPSAMSSRQLSAHPSRPAVSCNADRFPLRGCSSPTPADSRDRTTGNVRLADRWVAPAQGLHSTPSGPRHGPQGKRTPKVDGHIADQKSYPSSRSLRGRGQGPRAVVADSIDSVGPGNHVLASGKKSRRLLKHTQLQCLQVIARGKGKAPNRWDSARERWRLPRLAISLQYTSTGV
jgi:hypothetical protein